MKRLFVLAALVGLMAMVTAGPAFAGMIACPPQPPPGSTLECGVSNAEPDSTIAWTASFADGTELEGEVATDDEGAGGLAVDIPDDPELSGTEFTIALEEGGSYTGMVGAAEEGDGDAAGADEDAEGEVEVQGETEEADDAEAEDDADAQVTERPDEDSEVALGAGGTAGSSTPAALLAVALGLVLALGAGGYLVRSAVVR
jgi:hypothetical protein